MTIVASQKRSNVDIAKSILNRLPSKFTTKEAHAKLDYQDSNMTVEQLGKALRSINYVTNLGKGNFQVRGRRVYGNH